MKILYVAGDQDLSTYHGGTVHVIAVTRELIGHGHEVHVVLQESQSKSVELPAEAHVHKIRKRRRFLLWMAGTEIQTVLKEVKPDVVMERYYNFAGEAVIRAAALKVPSVLEVNSPMIEYAGSLKSRVDVFLFSTLRRRREKIARSSNLILCPIKEIVPPLFQSKVREIEWGADTELFQPAYLPDLEILRMEKGYSPDEVLLVHFGSLRRWHGVELLVDAFTLIRSKLKCRARLIVIGSSPEQKEQRSSIPESVDFVGMVPHHELPGWLKMCNIAVLPFSIENHRYLELGFYWSPLKVFEAMAMELPIITLNHPRLISILGTEDPAFFYDGSMENLSERIAAMVETLPVRAAAGKQFRDRLLRNYSWQAHGNKLNTWLQELTKR